MRWNEIVTEDLNVVQIAKNYILDILSTLKAQGVKSVTVDQVVQQLSVNPDLAGTQVDAELINQALNGVDGFSVEVDPETNQMSIMIDNPTAGRQVDKKQAEKDDKAIKSAALRSIAQKDRE